MNWPFEWCGHRGCGRTLTEEGSCPVHGEEKTPRFEEWPEVRERQP